MAVTLTNSGSLNTTLDNYTISVLSNTSSVNIGAVSLKFNVPGGVIVKDVNAGISATVSFLQKDKNLYIALFTTSNWTVNTNNTILSITASGMSTGSFTLDTTDEESYNEFASGSGDVFQNFDIKMPVLVTDIARVSDQLGLNSILFNSSSQTTAPSSTHLWTNSSNRLFYSSSALILNDGNTLGSEMTIGTNDNQNLRLETSGSVRVHIGNNGNVGVGTTTPTERLHVSGNIYTEDNLIIPSGKDIMIRDAVDDTTGTIIRGTYDRSGTDPNFDYVSTSSIFLAGLTNTRIDLFGTNTTYIGGLPNFGRMLFTIPNSGNALFSSPSNANILFVSGSGRVGIGTNLPTERLHVDGNLLVTGRITAQEFHTEFVSASIIYESGSTKFGNSSDDIHQFTGSLLVKGNSVFDGSIKFEPTQDPDPSGLDTDSTILFQSSSNTTLGYDLYFRQNGNIVKWKWFEGMLESGLLYGGVVTYSGSNVFVTPGSGIIVDHNATVGSEIGPIVDYVTWNAITQSITNIETQQVTYIYIDNDGVLQQQSSRFTAQQYHDYIPLGAVGHFNYSSISAFGGAVQTAYNQTAQIVNFIDAFGPLKLSGYGLTGQPSSLRLSVGSGVSYIHGGFYDSNLQFPSQYETNAHITASIAYVYSSGSGIRFDTNNDTFYTSLKPGFYDPGTGITASVSNNDWTIQRVYSDPRTGVLYIYYGRNIYPDYQNAIANLSTDSFSEGDTFDFTTFLGFLVLKSNTDDITNTTDNKIIPAGLFRGGGAAGGGGSAVTTLDDLTNVTITSPTNGQALVYNTGVWENGTPISSSYSITASFALNVDGGFY